MGRVVERDGVWGGADVPEGEGSRATVFRGSGERSRRFGDVRQGVLGRVGVADQTGPGETHV